MKTLKIYLGIMLFTVFAGCGEVQYTANEYGEPTYTFEELDNYGRLDKRFVRLEMSGAPGIRTIGNLIIR